jgi:hypothetical protein
MPAENFVMQRDRADDAAEATAFRTPRAQRTCQVAAVGMKRQMRVGFITAHVDVAMVPTMVVNVTRQIAARILRDRAAEIRPERPEDQADIAVAVIGDIQPAQHDEAAAGADFLKMAQQFRAECG